MNKANGNQEEIKEKIKTISPITAQTYQFDSLFDCLITLK